jgi:hypothetical protein
MKNSITLYLHLFIYLVIVSLFAYFTVYYIRPELIYHLQQPPFINSFDYFTNHLKEPGGIAGYVSNFLMQFYTSPWLGAIIILFVGAGIGGALTSLQRKIIITSPFPIVIPAIVLTLILFLKGTYLLHLSALVSILIALIAANVYAWVHRYKYGYVLLVLLSFITHYTAGGMALLLFCTTSILFLLFTSQIKHRQYKVLLLITTGLALPYLVYRFILPIPLSNAYFYIGPEVPSMLVLRDKKWLYALLTFFPAVILGTGVYSKLIGLYLKRNNTKTNNSAESRKSLLPERTRHHFLAVSCILVVLLAFYTYSNAVDKEKKVVTQADYHTYRMEWDKLLETINDWSDYDFMLNFYYNLAHLMKGTLPEKLLDYPQLPGVDALLLDGQMARSIAMLTSDVFYHLGYIAVSQVYAGEFQTLLPYSPRVLKRMCLNHIIQRDYRAAETYMHALDKNFLSRQWVKQNRAYLSENHVYSFGDDVLEKRSLMPQGRLVEEQSERKLRALLMQNPNNEKARDLLMAYYLLDHNLVQFTRMLSQQVETGEKQYPRLYHEALILYSVMGGEMDSNLKSIAIPPRVLDSFKRFGSVVSQHPNDKDRAKAMLSKDFRNTYWYYVRFDSPRVTGASIKQRHVK